MRNRAVCVVHCMRFHVFFNQPSTFIFLKKCPLNSFRSVFLLRLSCVYAFVLFSFAIFWNVMQINNWFTVSIVWLIGEYQVFFKVIAKMLCVKSFYTCRHQHISIRDSSSECLQFFYLFFCIFINILGFYTCILTCLLLTYLMLLLIKKSVTFFCLSLHLFRGNERNGKI